MGKRHRIAISFLFPVLLVTSKLQAQGIHFSQFYNAPMLTSPANTGLMSDKDFRLGANYRTQWGAVPVPFNSYSFSGDCQLFRNENQSNWLGLGLAAFSDRAGDGNLSTNRYEAFAAYHIDMGQTSMVSVGASVAAMQRSVDFSKLSFDAQWDGSDFNSNNSNNEKNVENTARYADVSAGVNYAYFPNEQFYVRGGVSLAHLNQPKETFLNQSNTVGMRTTVTLEALYRINSFTVINPSVYYTREKKASELLFGGMILLNVSHDAKESNLIIGIYSRLKDAIVGTVGYERNGLRIMASYDYTTSALAQYINHNGAFEVGIRYSGMYRNENVDRRRSYQCPRF